MPSRAWTGAGRIRQQRVRDLGRDRVQESPDPWHGASRDPGAGRKKSPAVFHSWPPLSLASRKNAAIATECACLRSMRALAERHVRRADLPGDHHFRRRVPGQVVRPALRVGDDQRGGADCAARLGPARCT